MKRIAVLNQKGGVGKTTTTQNLGAALARLGKRVLLIDFDPQAHLTAAWGVNPYELKTISMYNILLGNSEARENTVKLYSDTKTRGSVSLLPADLDLSAAEPALAGAAGRDYFLREALAGIVRFDYVFIDCPPSLGFFTVNALAAADSVYVPLQTEALAIMGLERLQETVYVVKKRLNPRLKVGGVIFTRFDRRRNLNRDVVETVKRAGQPVFTSIIRENIALAEAPSYGQDIFTYRPRSYGAEDYLRLAREVIKRG